MKMFKNGGRRLFETEEETSRIVSGMRRDLEKNGHD
jgi:hypothetical protein